MRKFLCTALGLALGLLASMHVGPAASQPVGPPNEIWCNRTAIVTSAAATVQAVAGVQSRGISICGWIASATAAATVQVIAGSGATCGTGTVNITAAHAIPAGGVLNTIAANAWYSVVTAAAPAPLLNVCVIVGGTGPVQVTLMYSQF